MMLQTYKLLVDLDCFSEAAEHAPMVVGQVVYGWPYADWGLCGPEDIAVMVTPMDVATIYAVPRTSLQMGEVVDLSVSVRDGIGCTPPAVMPIVKFTCVDSLP